MRVKDALEKLQDMFQVHVNAKGVEAMQRVTEEVERSKVRAATIAPTAVINDCSFTWENSFFVIIL